MLISATALAFSLIIAEEPVDAGLLLYQGFASKCKSNGPFSSRTLSESQTLQDVLVQVKHDGACKGLGEIFSNLIAVEKQFDYIHQGVVGETRHDLETYEKNLVIAYQLEVDPGTKLLLQQRLASVRMEIQETTFIEDQRQLAQREEAVQNLVQYLEQMTTSYADYQNCFNKYPSAPIQMASQLLSISGGFFDPTVSLAIGLAGRLMGTFFDYIANQKINKQISDYRKTTMRAGLTCAMEALEQSVCDIEDQSALVKRLLDYQAQSPVEQAWKGYDLFRREYLVVQRFLSIAEAGPDPEFPDQGRRQGSFYRRQGEFRAIGREILGNIAEAERDLEKKKNRPQSEKEAVVRNLIMSLSGVMLMGNQTPYYEVVPSSPDPHTRLQLWLRLGLENPPFLVTGSGEPIKNYHELLQILDTDQSPYSDMDRVRMLRIDRVRQTYLEIEARVKDNLDLEQIETVNTDQEGALATWTRISQVLPDAGVVIQKLIQYLTEIEETWREHADWFSSPQAQRDQVNIVADTKERFKTVLETLHDEKLDATQKLKIIYQYMELRDRDQFITNRVRNIVEQDLLTRLRAGMLVNDSQILDSLVRLSTDSLIRTLSPSGDPNARLMQIAADLRGARPTALENLLNFHNHYGESLGLALESLHTMATDAFALPEDDPIWEEYAKMCILAVNNPYLYGSKPQTPLQSRLTNKELKTNQKILKYCLGRTLHFYKNSQNGVPIVNPYNEPLSVSFDERLNLTPSQRLCSYRRSQNSAELYEILRQRPSAFFENYSNSTGWRYDLKSQKWIKTRP